MLFFFRASSSALQNFSERHAQVSSLLLAVCYTLPQIVKSPELATLALNSVLPWLEAAVAASCDKPIPRRYALLVQEDGEKFRDAVTVGGGAEVLANNRDAARCTESKKRCSERSMQRGMPV